MSSLNFLFWNTYQKSLIDEIVELVLENQLNFIILIENSASEDLFIQKLNFETGKQFRIIENFQFKKSKIITSISNVEIKEISGHNRYGIFEMNVPNFENIILTVTHFPSKINWSSPSDYTSLCVELNNDIINAENRAETNFSLIVGDFNMNPFEEGLVMSNGLHNTNNREIALTKFRKYQGKEYQYFFNPMWKFFGENSSKINGTHFYDSYKPINYFWNLFDQVMIRPDLIPYFDKDKLEIITKIFSKNLLKKTNGVNKIDKQFSDHLPLKFQLQLKPKEYDGKFMATV